AQAEPGLGRLRFAPGGRLGFVVHPEKNLVHLLDAASGRIIQTADVGEGPDQVTFSEELAYIRHQGTDQVLMIPLKTVGEEGRPVPLVDFPGGQHPPGRSTGGVPADGIVSAAGEAAVLVANPEDKAIYFYKEGMAAPMGHFQNYGRQPRAVLVVDRTLREIRPGVYETVARLTGAGDYELAVFLDAPRIVHC
ncbi:MAG TPA: cytochrome D1, partial [Acidobacteria bacterium]|nr:cytochrome D1 [Acidobacteriota bacterium]